MPKFMFTLNYTQAGIEGTLKEGFAAREANFRKMVEAAGATAEACYWTYGDNDIILVVDFPSTELALATALAANRTGAFSWATTPLLTAAEMDAAAAKMPDYRAPGA